MKKIFQYLTLAAAAAAVLASCAKEQQQAAKTWTITANTDAMRTELGGDARTVNWVSSDKVAVITYNSSTDEWSAITDVVLTSVSGSNAEFSVDVPDGYVPRYVTYPSRSSSRYGTGDPSGIRTKVDSPVYLKADNFASGSTNPSTASNTNTSIGVISGGSATMQNVMCLLKLTLSSDDIIKISVSGNNGESVSGFPYFDPSTFTLTGWSSGSDKQDFLPHGATFAPGTYYIPFVPQTFSKGITLTFTNSSGEKATKASASSWSPARNTVYNLGTEGLDWTLSWDLGLPDPFVMELVFSTGGASAKGNWPFKGAGSDSKYGTTGIDNAAFRVSGESGPYYVPDYPAFNFYMYTSTVKDGTSNDFRITGGAGLRIGSAYGDYFQLPAIKGYKLTGVAIEVGSGPCDVAVTDAVTDLHTDDLEDTGYLADFAAALVSGGDTQGKTGEKETPVVMSFTLTGTAANTAYRLTVAKTGTRTGKQVSGQKFTLTYTKVAP